NLWAYGRPAGNPGNDNTNLFRYWDNGQTDSLGNQIITPTVTDTILVDGQSRIFVMSGDEGHVYNNYLRHKADIFSLSGKISHSFKEWHWGSLGLEYKRSTIRYYQHLIPTNVWQGISGNGFIDAINYGYDDLGVESENTNWENEPKQPTNLSAYLDNIFKIGIIELRPSIRVDRWGLDALRLRNPVRPLDPDTTNDVYAQTLELSDMEKVDPNTKFSPRLSVGADIFNATRVQANAGIYYQLPPYAYLYNDFGFFEYKILTGGYFIPLANSALKPEKSTQVELEISHEFSRMVKVEVAGYLKWTRDQIQISTQPSLPRSFATYRNSDKSDIQGFEVGLNIRDGRNKSFELRYSFSNVDGIGSYPSTQSNIAWINTTPLDEMAPLDYDQRHKLTWILQLDYRGRGKYDQSFQILNEVLFNAVMSYNSSLPHTPIQISNEASLFPFAPIAIDETNSRRMKDRLTIDIRVERNIFIRGFEISPFVTITNLLDKKNVSNVWSYSGLPNSTGWLQTSDGQQFIQNTNTPDYNGLNGEEKYYIKEQLPGHYYAPRQFFFGLRGTF
ncbi:MAG TPA: TonB-dependent receptor, partial [candidate division Zixibacteria bacterium]|nr:TonB-dependent receptor [candidate division Zixibacteria bacterium]